MSERETEHHKRAATIHLNNKENPTFARVTLPHKITPPELRQLVEKDIVALVQRHTGCTCLSGTINVLIESSFPEAIHVNFAAPGAG